MKKQFRFVLLLLIVGVVSPLVAKDKIKVLATNSWTAAFVKMAGGEAEQLAPSSMTHPPEYELKPSDVQKIRDADLLVYAGYEVLMKTVFDRFDKSEDQLIKINTSYSPVILERSVLAIAEKLGTVDIAKRNISEYKKEIVSARKRLKAARLLGASVIVHFHQKPLAEILGFKILGVYGPQPFEVKQIRKFGKMKPKLIIDNAHNPMADPLERILKLDAIELVNFPEFPNPDGTVTPDTLTGVLKYNVERLLKR